MVKERKILETKKSNNWYEKAFVFRFSDLEKIYHKVFDKPLYTSVDGRETFVGVPCSYDTKPVETEDDFIIIAILEKKDGKYYLKALDLDVYIQFSTFSIYVDSPIKADSEVASIERCSMLPLNYDIESADDVFPLCISCRNITPYCEISPKYGLLLEGYLLNDDYKERLLKLQSDAHDEFMKTFATYKSYLDNYRTKEKPKKHVIYRKKK